MKITNTSLNCAFLKSNINILTENADEEIYMLESDNVVDIVNDWNNDCEYVPCNDAKVYFASYYGEHINPYLYTDFESLLNLLREIERVRTL